MKLKAATAVFAASLTLQGCSPARNAAGETPAGATPVKMEERVMGSQPPVEAIPKAVIYRTNGDYNNNVPLTMNGNTIVSFPAPSDVNPSSSAPVQLSDGYLLDRRGIGPNSVFTRFTYAEYAALPSPPSVDALKAAVIPGAKVTEIRELPMNIAEATEATGRINSLIADSLQSLPVIYLSPTVAAPSKGR